MEAKKDARDKSRAAKQARREDTRRKILVGAIVISLVERGEIKHAQYRKWLEGGLSRKDDWELFPAERDAIRADAEEDATEESVGQGDVPGRQTSVGNRAGV